MAEYTHEVKAEIGYRLASVVRELARVNATLSTLPALSAQGGRLRHRRDYLINVREDWSKLNKIVGN